MTIKQAMICNLISSFLCLLGVLVGLAIGSAHNTAPWIFAATGGMFLYIALVDMVLVDMFRVKGQYSTIDTKIFSRRCQN